MQKAYGHPGPEGRRDSRSLQAYDFRLCFTPLYGVLFTFPSRYLCTIGHRRVFSLGGRAPRIQTAFLVYRPTRDNRGPLAVFAYGTVTLCGAAFQRLRLTVHVPVCGSRNHPRRSGGFGLVRVRSPLLAESRVDFFSSGYSDVSIRRVWPRAPMCSAHGVPQQRDGFPHSEIPGSKPARRLPEAYRSLPRPSSPPST